MGFIGFISTVSGFIVLLAFLAGCRLLAVCGGLNRSSGLSLWVGFVRGFSAIMEHLQVMTLSAGLNYTTKSHRS